MGAVSFGWETVRAILDEPNLRELIVSYWEELSPIKETAALDPDFDRMLWLEEQGMFRVWAARNDSGTLIGLIEFQIMPHLNYKSTLFAFDMGHFLDPVYRGEGWVGVKMWRSALCALKEIGVKVCIAHDNESHPLAPLFARLEFEPQGGFYWKAL